MWPDVSPWKGHFVFPKTEKPKMPEVLSVTGFSLSLHVVKFCSFQVRPGHPTDCDAVRFPPTADERDREVEVDHPPAPLPAAARLHHHVLVLLVDHVVPWVDVEDADGAELGGGAAAGRHVAGVHGIHQSLDDGVVGGLQVGAQGEVTHALAVIRLVVQRGDDPVVPAQISEVDVQRLLAAPGFGLFPVSFPVAGFGRGRPPPPAGLDARAPLFGLPPQAQQRLPVPPLAEERLPLLRPGEHHQDGFLLLRPAVSVQAQEVQVQLPLGVVQHGPELQTEGLPSAQVLPLFENLPHVQHLPLRPVGILQVQRPGVQQLLVVAGEELDVDGVRLGYPESPRHFGVYPELGSQHLRFLGEGWDIEQILLSPQRGEWEVICGKH